MNQANKKENPNVLETTGANWCDLIKDILINMFFTAIFILPVFIISTTKSNNTELLKEFYAPSSSLLLHPLYIALTAIILFFQIKGQNAKEQNNEMDADQGVDSYWFFELKIDRFFQYANVTLACMIINTMITGYYLKEQNSINYLSLLAILANYFIIGLFPLTSPKYNNYIKWRIALTFIFVVFEATYCILGLLLILKIITG